MQDSPLNTFQQGSHPVLVNSNCDDRGRQEFVKSLKTHIQNELLPAVSTAYFQRAHPAYTEAHGHPPENHKQAREVFGDDPLFQAYLCLNRSSQELQWFSVIDAIDADTTLEERARHLPSAGGSIEVDKDFQVPKYISSIDIHCMPGCLLYTSPSPRD